MNTDEIKKLIESNANYWERRALENKLNIIENELDYFTRLEAIYKEANKQINEKLALIYQRYAKNNKITMDQAYKQLPKNMEKEYKDDVMDYINKAKMYGGDGKWKQYLLNQSLYHQHSVLDQMRTEYRNVIYNIDMENTQGKFLAKIYQNANYYAQYTDNEAGNKSPFANVSQERIQALLEENWSGAGGFSQLVWKNKELLIKALDDIVIKGLAVGDSFETMSKKLAERMGVSFKAARRLIMTESARMDNQGLLDWYKESGVEQFIFVATLDDRTSEICRSMDGLIFNIEDAQIGLNVPPLHPYCRSVISPYYEFNEVNERIYKDSNGNTQMGSNRTYDKYLEEEMADTKGAQAIVSQRNSITNLVKAVSILPSTSQFGMAASALTFFNPSEDYITKNIDMNNKFMDKYNIDREYVDEQVESNLKPLLENSDIAVRSTMESLDKILDDGRMMSQFETKKSLTGYRPELRADAEKTLFGYSLDMLPSNRPIYGYLTNIKNGFEFSSKNSAQRYGNVSIVLKKSVRSRTTFTVGDSLDGIYHWYNNIPNKIDEPSYTSMALDRIMTDQYGKYTGKIPNNLGDITNNVSYIETQIHKGVYIDDIDKVYISKSINTWRGKEELNISNSELNKLIKKLNKLGIDYEVVE